ncbi:MAG: PKD domain-containing protein [Saprospiraceae bacterium]
MKNLTVFFAALISCIQLLAQTEAAPVPRIAEFTVAQNNGAYQFVPKDLPLTQLAGAPEAYWSYYWEFGDGSYSFEKSPRHSYEKGGNYNQLLYATAHYDDGDKPKGRSVMMMADGSGQTGGFPTVFDSARLAIKMRTLRQARANEELVCILSYRNLGNIMTDGRLHLFLNEKKYPTTHFVFDSARVHFNEIVDADISQVLPTDVSPTQGWTLLDLPSHTGVNTLLSAEPPQGSILQNLLNAARGAYREEKLWRFTELRPGEKRNMFLSMRGTDKMLKDTNAFIYVTAIFAPFDPQIPPEKFDLEFEIVSAHDPNAIAVSDNRINYRTLGNKKIDYKIRFQNNGEGPASSVVLKVEIPEGLNMKKMKALEWEPKCPICPKPPTIGSCLDTLSNSEGLVFTFHRIYLPGSRQEGVNDRDSTKGFVKYRIEADRDMPKRSFRSRAKIIFDREPPIYTNYTRTRFKVGVSPGIKVGWNFVPDSLKSGYFFLGASISPYKSWRLYPQIELLTGLKGLQNLPEIKNSGLLTKMNASPNPAIPVIQLDSIFSDTLIQSQRGFVSFEVPVLLRKNFNKRLGLGFGASARVSIENGNTKTTIQRFTINWEFVDIPPAFVKRTVEPGGTEESVEPYSNTRYQFTAFGDLTFGSVRAGPNLGIRAGAVLGKGRAFKPFVQFSLEVKM